MDTGNLVQSEIIGPMTAAGIEVQEDAAALLKLACDNQLRSHSLTSERDLSELVRALTPDLPSAYRFKYGSAPLTFGRAVRLLADMAERWKHLRLDRMAAR